MGLPRIPLTRHLALLFLRRSKRAWMSRARIASDYRQELSSKRPSALALVILAALLGGCATSGLPHQGSQAPSEPETVAAEIDISGSWDGPDGTTVEFHESGGAVLIGVPAETSDLPAGSACEVSWEPMIATVDWSMDSERSRVHLWSEDTALLPLDLEFAISDDGQELSGSLCNKRVVEDWVFTRSTSSGP
jgi:hypothetical protein